MATLTEAMKQDLHIGNSQLAILPYTPGASYATPTDFSEADVLYTLEGTLNFDEGSPSTNPIRLDQKHEVIDDELTEDQEYTMTGDIPSINLALMEYFFEAGAAVSGVKSPDGDFTYAGKGFGAAKTREVVVLAVSQSKKTAIILNHVKMRLSRPKGTDNTTPKVMSITGACIADVNGIVVTPLPTATAVQNNG